MKLHRDRLLIILGIIISGVFSGFAIFLESFPKLTTHGFPTVLGNIAIMVVCIVLLYFVVILVSKEIRKIDKSDDEKEQNRHDELKNSIDALVNEIRKDRDERNKSK